MGLQLSGRQRGGGQLSRRLHPWGRFCSSLGRPKPKYGGAAPSLCHTPPQKELAGPHRQTPQGLPHYKGHMQAWEGREAGTLGCGSPASSSPSAHLRLWSAVPRPHSRPPSSLLSLVASYYQCRQAAEQGGDPSVGPPERRCHSSWAYGSLDPGPSPGCVQPACKEPRFHGSSQPWAREEGLRRTPERWGEC